MLLNHGELLVMNMTKKLWLFIFSLITIACVNIYADAFLPIEDFENGTGIWSKYAWNNSKSPLIKTTSTNPFEGKYALQCSFRSNKCNYLSRTLALPDNWQKITLRYRGEQPLGGQVAVYLTDKKVFFYVGKLKINSKKWQEFEITPSIAKYANGHNRKRKNYKVFSITACKNIAFVPHNKVKFSIDNIRCNVPAQIGFAKISTGNRNNIYIPGESPKFSYILYNTFRTQKDVLLKWHIADYNGKKLTSGQKNINVESYKNTQGFFKLPELKNGYYIVKIKAIHDGRTISSREFGIAVLAKPKPNTGRPFMAMNFRVTSYELARRIGVQLLELPISLGKQESLKPYSQTQKERLVTQIKKCHSLDLKCIGMILCEPWNIPPWASSAPTRKEHKSYLVKKNILKEFGEIIAKTGKSVGMHHWFICGEWDVKYRQFTRGIDEVADFINNLSKALKSGDPDAKVASIGVCDQDSNSGFPFADKLLKLVHSNIDAAYFDGYPNPRLIAPGTHVKEPETFLLRFLKNMNATTKKYGMKNIVGIQEYGYMMTNNLPLDGSSHKTYAKMLARSYLTARSYDPCQHLTWFTLSSMNTGEVKNTSYTLFRSNSKYPSPQPFPAVAAYSTISRFLNNTQNPKMINPRKGVYCLILKADKDVRLAVWKTRESSGNILNIPIPKRKGIINIYDIVGSPIKAPVNNEILSVKITDSPLYLEFQNVNFKFFMNKIKNKMECVELSAKLHLTLFSLNKAIIRIINNSDRAVNGRLKVRSGSIWKSTKKTKVYIPAKNTIIKPLAIQANTKVQFNKPYEFTASCILPSKINCNTKNIFSFYPLKSIKNSNELNKISEIIVADEKFIAPPVAIVHGVWSGVHDLNMRIKVAWDAKKLYIEAKVSDDIFREAKSLFELLNRDALRVGIDVNNSAKLFPGKRQKKDYYEFCFGTVKGQPSFISIPKVNKKGVSLNIKRKDKHTIYELAIAWDELNCKPFAGKIIGLNIIATDSDTVKNDFCFIGLSPGMILSKNTSLYKNFLLIK